MAKSPLHSTSLHTATIVKHKLNAALVLTLFTTIIAFWLNWRYGVRFISYAVIAFVVVLAGEWLSQKKTKIDWRFDTYEPSQDTLFTALLVVLLTPLTLPYIMFVLALVGALALHLAFRRWLHVKFLDPALFSVFVTQTIGLRTFRVPETIEGFFNVFDVNLWRVLSGFYDGFLLSSTSLIMMLFVAVYFLIARVIDRTIFAHVCFHALVFTALLYLLGDVSLGVLIERFGYGLPMFALIFIVAQYDTTPTDPLIKALYALLVVALYATLYRFWEAYPALVVAILSAQSLAVMVENMLKRPLLWGKAVLPSLVLVTYGLFALGLWLFTSV